jgi:hypothetical protein
LFPKQNTTEMKTRTQLSTDFSTITSLANQAKFRPLDSAPEGAEHYPELIAKTRNRPKCKFPQFEETEALPEDSGLANHEDFFEHFIQDSAAPDPVDKIYKCSKGFIWGESSQNNFYKMLTCGKEWCPDCGKKHSIPHDRRIHRKGKSGQTLLENFLALNQAGESVQYLVITIPRELRPLYRSQEALSRFRVYWRDKLKREGHRYGFSRYHYAGDDGYIWKPHLNILSLGGFIPADTLRTWRSELSRWFKMEHGLDYSPKANIYTSYTMEGNKIRHWLSYITRATQTKYNKLNENTIKAFRNCAPFKDSDFEIPTYQREEREKSEEESAAAEGFDLLPDGTKEKIIWRMKYCDIKRKWRPEVVLIEHTRLDELQVIRRGFWKEKKYSPPPEPVPEPEFSAQIFCPF